MKGELCFRVFAKFIIYMSLLLWQLGHEFKFQTTAQGTNETDPVLPQEEGDALEFLAERLGLKGRRSFTSFNCSASSSGYSDARISCNCDFNDGKTCHINRLSWSYEGLKGSLPEEVANLTYLESLDLSGNEIQGSIPDIWGNMSRLNKLDLSNNQLTGPIPKSLGYLKAQVPEKGSKKRPSDRRLMGTKARSNTKGRCSNRFDRGRRLSSDSCPTFNLDLSNNHLEGSIPNTLGNIIVDLRDGKSLKPDKSCYDFYIYLNDNRLNGSIPKTLRNLKFLTGLDLQNNLLTGPIPPSLGDLSFLKYLSLSENQLNGSLPHELGNLTSLSNLFFQSNYLTGNFPESYAKLINLYLFSISGNYLSGPFPQFITNWTRVNVLSFYGNNFTGNIPLEIFNLSELNSLTISDVETSPFEIPSSANFTYLQTLVLRKCSIIGQIPSWIANLSFLEFLDLSFNNLTGGIPRSLQKLNLAYMSFAENNLSGSIPDWISHSANSTMIDLSFNNFSNASNLFQRPRNPNLNLFSCCRSCKVSINCEPDMRGVDELKTKSCAPDGKPKYHSLYINCGGEEIESTGKRYWQDNSTISYGASNASKNQNWAFSSSGSFLSTDSNSSDYIKKAKCGIAVADALLYSTARLAPVSLKYYGFCLLDGSYNVTLSFAELVYTGDDDTDHSNVKKRIFDVYIQNQRVAKDYHVTGTANIDLKNVQDLENHTTMVKNGILEIHLYWAGKGSSGNPPDFNGPLLSAISVTPKGVYLKENRGFQLPFSRRKWSINPLDLITNFKVGGGKGLTRSHIAMITLGSITFALFLSLLVAWLMGWLEKEELHDINVDDDTTVTLKELIAATGGFNEDAKIGEGGFGTVYRAELRDHKKVVAVKKLSNLSNEGIEKLKVGIYNLQTLRHNNFVRLLDIHVGKDLCFLVYEYMANKSLADALFEHKIKLDNWDARFNICVEVAKGLQYLHEKLKKVHWGIKAANILLDGELKPKISDLGLASASVENDENSASHFLWMMKAEASTGYMAPEYPSTGKKSGYKYDVYSFGVVMLEIVCGRKNVGPGQKNKQELEILVDKVREADENGRLLSLVDESLRVYDTKQAMTVLKLAMRCTMSASVRPTMCQVVRVLTGEKSLKLISMPAPVDDEITTTNEQDSSEALAL